MAEKSNGKKRSFGINIVTLTSCFVGKDAEVQYTSSGVAYARFSVAFNDSFANKNGDVTTSTYWFPCVIWGKQAEAIGKFITKGKMVDIVGKLTQKMYEGKSYIEIVVGGQIGSLTLKSTDGGSVKNNSAKQDSPEQDEAPVEEEPEEDIPF